MSTTLPLFWHLSSARKQERIDASVKLVAALERFQTQFVQPPAGSDGTDEDEEEEVDEEDVDEGEQEQKGDGLDASNAQDVSYSIRRLVRGLASPRESSRLGFAVALTELLSRLTSITCAQIVALVLDSSLSHGSMSGQEERDVLFARLFGLTAVIRSGLLVRTTPLSPSPRSPAQQPAATLASFQALFDGLAALGARKAYLREGASWALGLAVDALGAADVPWKQEAADWTVSALYDAEDARAWTPEKVALTVRLQRAFPKRKWRETLAPTFKHAPLLHTSNYAALARIMKDLGTEEDDEDEAGASKKGGQWKAQVHYVWDLLLDEVLSPSNAAQASFPEFFRILVDESLFSAASSPERKSWGFQIFRKALPRVREEDVPMLFTKNFMRSWINHLSNSGRYLHKAAKLVANDIQAAVKQDPAVGLTLVLQLTGSHGSEQFDRLTKTKTVETILTSMTADGIRRYVEYLLERANDEQPTKDVQALNARRAWIVDQLAALVRNGAVPRDDAWVETVLDWLVVHGLFAVKKKSEKSSFVAIRDGASPVFSDELRKACRERLLSSLAELTTHASQVKIDGKIAKTTVVASDGEFWVTKVLATIEKLEGDTKHVTLLSATDDEDEIALRSRARELIKRLKDVTSERREAARGAQLLLSATLVHLYCTDDNNDDGDEAGNDSEALEACIDAASRMFPVEPETQKKGSAKKGKDKAIAGATDESDDAPAPVDVLVDTVIGFLERATAYMRAVANQAFALLSGSVQESTVDLILAQIVSKSPEELAENEDDEDEDEDGDNEDADEDGEDNDDSEEEDDDDDDEVIEDDEELDDEDDPELRRKIEEALQVNGIHAATGDSDDESDEELMDDEQMMAIDEQLAAVFRARADEKRLGKGVDAQREATHYKNRVLDLLDTFIRKQPTSPLVPRVILPLSELVVNAGSDEKQLADKATGILRSRIGKAKEVPSDADTTQAGEALRELHSRARRAFSADIVATLSQCSLYLSRVLASSEPEAVVDAYRESLVDFISRKASRLHTSFFLDFIRRQGSIAWGLRDDLLELVDKAVNGYRQNQAFQLVQVLLSQSSATANREAEVLKFMPALRASIQRAVSSSCETGTLTAPHIKDALKLALFAARLTRRVAPSKAQVMWEPASWDALRDTLAASDRFKSSTGLQAQCTQLTQVVAPKTEKAEKAKGKAKRKAEDLGAEDDVEVSSKKSGKKAKKAKA
ncbi:hypothetical protein BDW22DRAFT_1486396 [Trametopsis cervina]|nr:hypothetical protein BDW22DRAFT_1486396 [Trametopsis cervina]